MNTEAIYKLNDSERFLYVQISGSGEYDYSVFDKNYNLIDGGIWDDDRDLTSAARTIAYVQCCENSIKLLASSKDNNFEELFEKLIF